MPYPAFDYMAKRISIGDGCWNWMGGRQPRGYGTVSWRNEVGDVRGMPAHRFVYQLLVGSIADGLELDHLCRNKACVRPDHLEPVTRSENQLRYAATIPVPAGLPTPSRRGRAVNRRGEGRSHGYESTYAAGCRCELCRAARRVNSKRRREARAA